MYGVWIDPQAPGLANELGARKIAFPGAFARDDQLLHMIALVASNAEKPSALDEERPSAIPLLPVP